MTSWFVGGYLTTEPHHPTVFSRFYAATQLLETWFNNGDLLISEFFSLYCYILGQKGIWALLNYTSLIFRCSFVFGYLKKTKIRIPISIIH